jgi:tRNA-binding EMAP/Myf-like protein
LEHKVGQRTLLPSSRVGHGVVVVCNLKKAKLGGFDSYGIVLCATDEAEDVVKIAVGSVMDVAGRMTTKKTRMNTM